MILKWEQEELSRLTAQEQPYVFETDEEVDFEQQLFQNQKLEEMYQKQHEQEELRKLK